MLLLTLVTVFAVRISTVIGQNDFQVVSRQLDTVRWCTIGRQEHEKCQAWAEAIKSSGQFKNLNMSCVPASGKDDCMSKLDADEADLVTLDPGEIFTAGRYHSLVPIAAERYGINQVKYFAVAVIRRNSGIRTLNDLRGKDVCFTGVGRMAGWTMPISRLLKQGVIPVVDCNNYLKSVARFFNRSCAVNALEDKHNPTGDNPTGLCSLCHGWSENRCIDLDPASGFDGAFRCFLSGPDRVAFVKHTTIQEMLQNGGVAGNVQDFELMCPSGEKRPVGAFESCNWGVVQAHAIVTSSATPMETRRFYHRILMQSVQLFGGGTSQPQFGRNRFELFRSAPLYGDRTDLLFSDISTGIEQLNDDKQNFKDYLGVFEENIAQLRTCPVATVRLCVVSEPAFEKCKRMTTAFRTQMFQPSLYCVKAESDYDCMLRVAKHDADVVMLDAGDVYRAGKEFNLRPILAEQYNLDGPYMYAVAVAKIDDPETDLLFLKTKHTCHTGYGHGAGWILPISFLIKNDRLRNFGCDGSRSAAEFFQKACVPGFLSGEYNSGLRQENMCGLCHGSGGSFCSRDHSEDFYGHTGALRCLIEGGGEIAFVKHTAIFENVDGRNRMWWSRNVLTGDLELLCRDGSRARPRDYADCNIGKVPSNAMVTRRGNDTEANAFANVFYAAQHLYGSKYDDDNEFRFQMFSSGPLHHDLIFQDATQLLRVVESANHVEYLGYDFVDALRTVDCNGALGFTSGALSVCVAAAVFVLQRFL